MRKYKKKKKIVSSGSGKCVET